MKQDAAEEDRQHYELSKVRATDSTQFALKFCISRNSKGRLTTEKPHHLLLITQHRGSVENEPKIRVWCLQCPDVIQS